MSSSFFMCLGGLTLLGYLFTTLEFIQGNRIIPKLAEIPLPEASSASAWPRVSIIIPARNEERNLEAALSSVLKLDYPNYELIVLNDRSEDRTGDILERMAASHPRLKVVHISELPGGWLGKNHALFRGAQASTGELLLFTDADIVMTPDTLRRAVSYLQSGLKLGPLDHLAMMPEIVSPSLGLSLFMNAFSIYFALYARPWRVSDPKSKAFIGVGAFNLLRRSVYEQIGTHGAIALRPDDDMKLGKLVKKAGFRQAVGNGLGLLRVEWYASLGELVEGLMKNAFAGLEYSLLSVAGGSVALFLFGIWPLLALFVTQGPAWWMNLFAFALMQLLCWANARAVGLNRLSGLFFPFSTLLMIYIMLRATALNLAQNGIFWRGTHYTLAELKANRV